MKNKYLYLFWFIALLPVMIGRDFTPDNELRYLSIVDEALRNGNIFTFSNQGVIYAEKPPLYFWLMMIGKVLLGGHHMWFLSLLSFVPALVILITMTRWIQKENKANEQAALLMLMTCGLFAGLTLIVRMDMLMSMFITLSLYTFYKIYNGENRKRDEYLFPLYVFLALFSKGPIGLLVPLISTILFLLYKRKLHTIKRYWGWKSLSIILAGCMVWFIGVYMEGGKAYLDNLVIHQTVGRGINAFHHKEPFYFYLTAIWYSLAPWSLLVVGLIIAELLKKRINTDVEQFFVIIILSTFIMLSIISSKLSVYLLPIIPFSVYLTVLLLNKFDIQYRWIKIAIAFPAALFISVLPVIFYLKRMEEMAFLGSVPIFIAGGILTISGLMVLYLLYHKKKIYRAIYTLAIGILLSVFVAGWSMPELNKYLGWGELCKKAKILAQEKRITDYYVYDIHRAENMDVYLGKDIKIIEKEDLMKSTPTKGIILLPTKEIKKDEKLRSIIERKEYYTMGNYAIVVF